MVKSILVSLFYIGAVDLLEQSMLVGPFHIGTMDL